MSTAPKITFELQIFCMAGWDDEEDIALLEVDAFEQVLRIATVLKKRGLVRYNDDPEVLSDYREILSHLQSESGKRVMSVGEVIGIQVVYEDDRGFKSKMTLSDETGVSGFVHLDQKKYDENNLELLREAKQYATKILRL